jgi:glutamyl/glutaminyl-tRNA synthetase
MKMPLNMKCRRLAVTSKTSSPSLCHLLQVLGKERVMARIEKTLASIG